MLFPYNIPARRDSRLSGLECIFFAKGSLASTSDDSLLYLPPKKFVSFDSVSVFNVKSSQFETFSFGFVIFISAFRWKKSIPKNPWKLDIVEAELGNFNPKVLTPACLPVLFYP